MIIQNGLFVVFEGVDGSGKSTQIEMLQTRMHTQGIDPLVVREPGGTELGEKVRDILLSHQQTGMHPRAEMFLFCASRSQLVASKIIPTLENGGVVIADRYRLSTEIYQGIGRGLPLDDVKHALDFATQNLLPQFTFIFDLSYQDALTRKNKIGDQLDRMEAAGADFFSRIQKAFASVNDVGCVHIDALQDVNQIHNQIWQTIVSHQWWMNRSGSLS